MFILLDFYLFILYLVLLVFLITSKTKKKILFIFLKMFTWFIASKPITDVAKIFGSLFYFSDFLMLDKQAGIICV